MILPDVNVLIASFQEDHEFHAVCRGCFGAFVGRIRNPPDSLIGLAIVFAVGGVIMSLALRSRTRA